MAEVADTLDKVHDAHIKVYGMYARIGVPMILLRRTHQGMVYVCKDFLRIYDWRIKKSWNLHVRITDISTKISCSSKKLIKRNWLWKNLPMRKWPRGGPLGAAGTRNLRGVEE